MCMREQSSLSFSLAHVALNGFPLSVMSSICYYSHAVLFCSSETSSPAGNVRLTEQRRTGRRQCIDSIRVKHQWSSKQLASNLVNAFLTSPFLLPPSLPTPPHRVLCQTHSSPTPTHAASSQTLRTAQCVLLQQQQWCWCGSFWHAVPRGEGERDRLCPLRGLLSNSPREG